MHKEENADSITFLQYNAFSFDQTYLLCTRRQVKGVHLNIHSVFAYYLLQDYALLSIGYPSGMSPR